MIKKEILESDSFFLGQLFAAIFERCVVAESSLTSCQDETHTQEKVDPVLNFLSKQESDHEEVMFLYSLQNMTFEDTFSLFGHKSTVVVLSFKAEKVSL